MMKEVRLEVNKRCNYSCIHCYTDKVLDENLPLELYYKAIDEAIKLGASDVSLTGGEPLLAFERTLSIVRYSSARRLDVRLNTNGHILNEEKCRKLVEAGLTEIQISLNGHDAKGFDAFTQVTGSFERVVNAIRIAVELVPEVSVRFTLMEYTVDELVPTFELVKELGVTKFKVRTLVQASEIHEELTESLVSRMKKASKHLFVAASDGKIQVHLSDNGLGFAPPVTENIKPLECLCGHNSLFVTAQGVITPCPFVRDYDENKLGSIKDDSLVDVFNKSNADPDFEFRKVSSQDGCVHCAAASTVLQKVGEK